MSTESSPTEEPTATVAPPNRSTPGGAAPQRFGRYVSLELLGEGGMGEVYRAHDPKLGRDVALKRIRSEVRSDAVRTQAMMREAQAMAKLRHPNVVPVFDLEQEDGDLFLAMAFVEGNTLHAWLNAGDRTWSEVIDMFRGAGEGLAAAHRAGLVHGDFKAGNVLVDENGLPMVTDFGLARLSSEPTAGETSVGSESSQSLVSDPELAGVGTPRYMPPEQHEGEKLDGRADQFAFCVALWSALNGRPPFDGDTKELLKSKLEGPPRWPSPSKVPAAVRDAIRRGLMPDPDQRWPSMEGLLESLQAERSRRRGWTPLVSIAVMSAAGIGIGLALSGDPPPEDGEARGGGRSPSEPQEEDPPSVLRGLIGEHNLGGKNSSVVVPERLHGLWCPPGGSGRGARFSANEISLGRVEEHEYIEELSISDETSASMPFFRIHPNENVDLAYSYVQEGERVRFNHDFALREDGATLLMARERLPLATRELENLPVSQMFKAKSDCGSVP